ncbi:MAG TPA: cobalt ECF transporter T component CbiQ [Roseiflexaceae bacterium]|nr:cobalt ECF transporter T component CbiQ [Roseiflexaceae bacterium]
MRLLDRYAYACAIRRVDPAQKAALALLAILLCLLLDRPAVGLLAVLWMLALAALWARVPAAVFVRVLCAEAAFLALSVLGVALSAGMGVPAAVWAWRIGPLWVGSSPAALETTLRLVARALGCASALNFLILTAPMVDLIDLLRRLRVSETLIDVMMITYRAIFILLDSMGRMYAAQDARLGYRDARRALRSAALLASGLFLDAFRRSRRMQLALECRGMDGPLRVLPAQYVRDGRTPWLAAALAASLLAAALL